MLPLKKRNTTLLIKRHFSIVLSFCLSLISYWPDASKAQQTSDFRAIAITKIEENKALSPEIKSEILSLLKDKAKIISQEEVLAKMKDSKRPTEIAQGYLLAFLVQNYNDPDKIIELDKNIPLSYQGALVGFFWGDRTIIHKQYSAIGFHQLELLQSRINELSGDPKEVKAYTMSSRIALAFLKTTKDPQVPEKLENFVKQKITTPALRGEIVGEAVRVFGCASSQMGKWYYKEYCMDPGECATFERHFRKCLDAKEAEELIAVKQKQLKTLRDAIKQ